MTSVVPPAMVNERLFNIRYVSDGSSPMIASGPCKSNATSDDRAPSWDHASLMSDDIIFGRNPVLEALKAEHAITKLLIAQGSDVSGPLNQIVRLARAQNIPTQFLPRPALDSAAVRETKGLTG